MEKLGLMGIRMERMERSPRGAVPPGAPLRGGSHLESKKQLASSEEVKKQNKKTPTEVGA